MSNNNEALVAKLDAMANNQFQPPHVRELLKQASEALSAAGSQSVPEALRDNIRQAIAESLGEAYDCLRVWSAWSYGTMGPDDFSLVAEDGDRLEEIVEAVMLALTNPDTDPSGEAVAVTQFRHPQWSDKTRWHDCDDAESGSETMGLIGMTVRTLYATPPDTVPRSELEAAKRDADLVPELLRQLESAEKRITELQAKAVPAGMALVPVVASPDVMDRAVSFALNVSLSSEYTWSDYMRDLWAQMLSTAPAPENQCDGCLQGSQKIGGIHYNERGHPTMACQAHQYAAPAPAASPVVPDTPYTGFDADLISKMWSGESAFPVTALPASDLSGSECGNCFEGKSDLDHECQKCGGTGEVK